MTTTIRVLSDQTIDQIAAGEVIENPASVVKELVENAIDAKATHIRIDISGGGLGLIRVSDDGIGMSREDALLSVQRHATSKIVSASDLFALSTMGFRGEALASIASISDFTLTTALEKQTGTKIVIVGGRQMGAEVCARARGTTVEVRSLFYNVPARKKFQKAAAVSAAEITRQMVALALANPLIGFEVYHGEKEMIRAPAGQDLGKRIGELLGEEFTSSLITVSHKTKDWSLEGYISLPLLSRPNRTGQHLFLNQRAVFCLPLSFAVLNAYGTRLDQGRHPLFVLHLTLPPSEVDVNVHPQKKEIRLKEEAQLKEQIEKAVRMALASKESAAITFEEMPIFSFPPPESSFRCQEAPSFVMPIQQEISVEATQNFLGIFAHFFLIQDRSQLMIVDGKRAFARVFFERMLSSKKTAASQGLLLPITVSLSLAEAALVEAELPQFEKMGIGIRPLGKGTFIIDAIPTFTRESDFPDILLQVAHDLKESSQDEKIARLARIAAVHKKGFMIQEAKALFEELMRTSAPYQCPQGKSIMRILGESELDDLIAKKK